MAGKTHCHAHSLPAFWQFRTSPASQDGLLGPAAGGVAVMGGAATHPSSEAPFLPLLGRQGLGFSGEDYSSEGPPVTGPKAVARGLRFRVKKGEVLPRPAHPTTSIF